MARLSDILLTLRIIYVGVRAVTGVRPLCVVGSLDVLGRSSVSAEVLVNDRADDADAPGRYNPTALVSS